MVTEPMRDLVRLSEWRQVREFLTGARRSPAALAIEGEAGSGKSTLWRAGAAAAAAAGGQVLCSEPTESEAEIPFVGLSDLLTGLLPWAGELPAPQRDAIEAALLIRDEPVAPVTPRAVGLAVLGMLRAGAGAGPVVIAIDDAQWLDRASLDALGFALRRLGEQPVSVFLTARIQGQADPLTVGSPPPPAQWRELTAAFPGAVHVALGPLGAEQVRRVLGTHVAPRQAQQIAEQARGNPFWAREITMNMHPHGAALPQPARVLEQRLSRLLNAEAAEALAVVAAGGRMRVADALSALDHLADPAAALDEAAVAGVLTEAHGRLTTAHPLIGAAALDAVPPVRRRQLYQRLAEVSANPERHAQHAAMAAGPGPDSRVAEALDAAAAHAHARAAYRAAAQFAVQAVTFTPAGDDQDLVRRRIQAAEMLSFAGDLDRALDHLEVLDVCQLSTPDLERALPLLLDAIEFLRSTDEAASIVTKAVRQTEDSRQTENDPRRRALVLSLAADVLYGIPGGRGEAAREAIRCAERAGAAARTALHRALIGLATTKASVGEGLDVSLLDEAGRLEADMPPLRIYEQASLNRANWSRYVEDFPTAREMLTAMAEQARADGDDATRWIILPYLAATELITGNYRAAVTALDEADAATALDTLPPTPWLVELRCRVLIVAGDLDAALELAAAHLQDDSRVFFARFFGACVRGQVSAWRGDAAEAIRHFERAGRLADERDWTDPEVRHRIDPALGEAYAAAGRLADARRVSARLRRFGTRLGRQTLLGDAARIDALTAVAAGDLAAAAESARAAVRAHRASPLRPELARSLFVRGRIEWRRKSRRDARAILLEALELATELGHQPLRDEIQREVTRIRAARSGRTLTATEQRVAQLIAGGATNREAAEKLFVSVRTVESHVAAIFRKLGVHARDELPRLLFELDTPAVSQGDRPA
jgi:DNA-binding CsgD family transcriptional regulator